MERILFYSAVFLVLEENGRWFTLRRANSGFMDGKLQTPSGHLELGETPLMAMVREAEEEAGIQVRAEDLELCHTQFYFGGPTGGRNYYDLFFKVKAYSGIPHNAEPEKASEAVWADIDDKDLAPAVRLAWTSMRQGIMYSEFIAKKEEIA